MSAAGLVDSQGNSGVGGLSEMWTMNTTGPAVVSIAQTLVSNGSSVQSPTNTTPQTLYVTFSEPIVPTSFTYQSIVFSKQGGANLIVTGITIAPVSAADTEFEVSNFENLIVPIDGQYTFTVNTGGIQDLAGNSGTGSSAVSWNLVTAPLSAPTNLAISPDTGYSSTDGITNVSNVAFTGTLSEPGLTVYVSIDGNLLPNVTVAGTTFSQNLTLQPGKNTITVYAVDSAGNVSATTSYTAYYSALNPLITLVQSPPTQTSQPAVSVTVSFTSALYAASFTPGDVSLTANGQPVATTGLTLTPDASDMTFTIGGLAPFDSSLGNYQLTIGTTDVQDLAGNAALGSVTATWSVINNATVTATAPNGTYTALHYAATAKVSKSGGGAITDGSISFLYYNANDLTRALPVAPTTVGSYDVVAVFSGDGTYGTAQSTPVPFSITRTPLTVTGQGATVPYGQTLPTLLGTTNGFLGSDAAAVAYAFTAKASQGSLPGTYSISESSHDPLDLLANYNATYVSATLTITKATPTVTLTGPSGPLVYDGTTDVTNWAKPQLAGVTGGIAPTGSATMRYYAGSSTKGKALTSVPVNAGTYTAVANYAGDSNYLSAASNPVTFTISPAPVSISLQSNLAQPQAGQVLSLVAVTSTTAAANGVPLVPPGIVTFYDNGVAIDSQPLAVVSGHDQAVFNIANLPLGPHQITVGYTGGVNFAMACGLAGTYGDGNHAGDRKRLYCQQYQQRSGRRRKPTLDSRPGGRSQRPVSDRICNGQRAGVCHTANYYP